jgi:hypoxanthine phosphoribosyltransferase
MEERVTIKDRQFRLLISESKIKERVKEIAGSLNRELAGKFPLFIAVLNGSFIFAADLIREINIPCAISFVKVSSYAGIQSTGQVTELLGLNEEIEGRNVVIIEDIVDSGTTIDRIMKVLQERKIATVSVATALLKPGAYKGAHVIKHAGFSVGDEFVVGYGLDYDGEGRNLKGIHVLV